MTSKLRRKEECQIKKSIGLRIALGLAVLIFCFSCKQIVSENYDQKEESCSIPDGNYSAIVEYKNPSTNYVNRYNLNVDIMDNQLVSVHFPNQGAINQRRAKNQYMDADCSIHFLDDLGRSYTVQILNQ